MYKDRNVQLPDEFRERTPTYICHRYCCLCSSHVSFAEPRWRLRETRLLPKQPREYLTHFELEAASGGSIILNTTEWELTALAALRKSMLSMASPVPLNVANLERRQVTALKQILNSRTTVGAGPGWQALHLPAAQATSSLLSHDLPSYFESKGKAWQWVVRFIDQCGGATDFYTPDMALTKPADASCCLPGMCFLEGEWCMPNGCIDDLTICEDHSNFFSRAIQRMASKLEANPQLLWSLLLLLVVLIVGLLVRCCKEERAMKTKEEEYERVSQGNRLSLKQLQKVDDPKLQKRLLAKQRAGRRVRWTCLAHIMFYIYVISALITIIWSVAVSLVAVRQWAAEKFRPAAKQMTTDLVQQRLPQCVSAAKEPSWWDVRGRATDLYEQTTCDFFSEWAPSMVDTFIIEVPTLIEKLTHKVLMWILTQAGIPPDQRAKLEPYVKICEWLFVYAPPISALFFAKDWADSRSYYSRFRDGQSDEQIFEDQDKDTYVELKDERLEC